MGEIMNQVRNQLNRTLEEHELAKAKLETLREQVQTEIEMHELLLSLGRNERLLDYFENLEEDFSRADSLRGSSFSDEERHRMQIPTSVSFEVGPNAESLADMRMLVRHRTWLIEVVWNRQHGLVARPIEGHPSTSSASLSPEPSERERALRPPESES